MKALKASFFRPGTPTRRIAEISQPALTFLLCLAMFGFGLASAHAAQTSQPVSSPAQFSASGAGNSFLPAFSADGRRIVFVSQAHNLVTNDNPSAYLDVFAYDLAGSNVALVSAGSSGFGGGNYNSSYPSISSNGQFIVFASAASNLAPNDTNNASDVFLRDLNSGVTRLVSVDLFGSSPANPFPYQSTNIPVSGNPMISADARYVFFESAATNMVSLADNNMASDIFVRDLVANQTTLITVNYAGTGAGSGSSSLGGITPDGRWAAFASKSTNLVPTTHSNLQEVFLRDLQANKTYWASSNALNPSDVSAFFFAPVVSANGRFVYFKKNTGSTSNAVPEELWRFDVQDQSCLCLHTNTLPNDFPSPSRDGSSVAFAAVDGLYLWQESLRTNQFLGCGSGPSLSLDGAVLAYQKSDQLCGASPTNGIYVMELPARLPHLVSKKLDGSAASFVESAAPVLSPDGRFVAFESPDPGIVANDLNQAGDVFVQDWTNGVSRLVSQAHPLRPARTAAAFSCIIPNCISTNGRYVVFTSLDGGLVPGDTNGWADVFARDLQTGQVIPLSVDVGVGPNAFRANWGARDPAISGNGQVVAWVWHDMVNQTYDVYARQLNGGANWLVSQNKYGNPSGASFRPVINNDGTMIAFQSTAVDMVGYAMVDAGVSNIYLNVSGTNQLVSVYTNGTRGGLEHSYNLAFTPDSHWLVFQSDAAYFASNAAPGLFARNLLTSSTHLVSTDTNGTALQTIRGFSITPDSRYVVFSGNYTIFQHDLLAASANQMLFNEGYGAYYPSISADRRWLSCLQAQPLQTMYLFLKDLTLGEGSFLSVNGFTPRIYPWRNTFCPISADGRFILFSSFESNLVDSVTYGLPRVYVTDRLLGRTMLLGTPASGPAAIANFTSSQPYILPDSRTVVFQSFAPLVDGDYNNTQDIFVVNLGALDSDNDGMDDDWEMAYFGNLSRDGTGDYDGDGMTDKAEFLAGTDPTNQGSVLRALTVTSVTSGSVTVLWNAVAGRTYRVQYKTNITQTGWLDLTGNVYPTNSLGAKVDATVTGNQHRYYRVVCQP